MANKANIVAFKSSPGLIEQLKDLQLFYGQKTRSKLLVENILPEAIVAIYKSPKPKGLTKSQEKAYKRIMLNMRMVDAVAKELLRMQREREKENKKHSKTKKKLSKRSKTKRIR